MFSDHKCSVYLKEEVRAIYNVLWYAAIKYNIGTSMLRSNLACIIL
jgi:hypothetical protein